MRDWNKKEEGSRPLISLQLKLLGFDESIRSRPLPGVLISLPAELYPLRSWVRVLVPFPGFLYLYILPDIDPLNISRSRPLPGVLISLLSGHV